MKDKIIWKKPNHKKVSDKKIEEMCIKELGGYNKNISTGNVRIEREQYGRKITFEVWKVEKVGELTEGIDVLTRQQAIDELKKLNSRKKQSEDGKC